MRGIQADERVFEAFASTLTVDGMRRHSTHGDGRCWMSLLVW